MNIRSIHSTRPRPGSAPLRPATGRLAVLGVIAAATLAGVSLSSGAAATTDSAPRGTAPVAVERTATGTAFNPDAAADFGVEREVNFPIRMNDGTLLLGNVYYPTDLKTGRRSSRTFPVLITMTPYGQYDGSADGRSDDVMPSFFAAHGYICLVMDTRGSGRSGGVYSLESPQEMRDYLEVIHFAAKKLAGSNGVVGLSGMSYRGVNQLLVGGLLKKGTPVKAMAPASAGYLSRGIFLNGGMPAAFGLAYAGIESVAELPPPIQATAGGFELAQLGQLLNDRPVTYAYHLQWLSDLVTGGTISYGDWWRVRDPLRSARPIVKAGVPVLLTSGQNDFFVRGSLDMYAALQSAAHGRPVHAPMDRRDTPSPKYQLVWSGTYSDGAYDYFLGYELQWYDHWLKGVRNGVGNPHRTLHVQEQGGKQHWVDVPNSVYPMTRNYTQFYLGATQRLTRASGTAAAADSLAWAPNAKLGYTTAPFAKGATLAGPVSATLFTSTSGSDVELVATLQDVAPDGSATTVVPGLEVDGAQIASQRAVDPTKSWRDVAGRLIHPYHPLLTTTEQPLLAGRVVRVSIEMLPRVWTIAPGHSLRLVVASQDPVILPTIAQVSRLLGSTAQVWRGGDRASYLNLPVLPFNAFATAGDPTRVGLAAR